VVNEQWLPEAERQRIFAERDAGVEPPSHGKARFSYNWLGIERYEVAAGSTLPSGEHILRFDFAYDGGKSGSGGVVSVNAPALRKAGSYEPSRSCFPAMRGPMLVRIWRPR
jgi:hypothetical protein